MVRTGAYGMNATSRINEDQADGAYGLTARYTRVLGLWVRLGGDPTVHPYTIVQYSSTAMQ